MSDISSEVRARLLERGAVLVGFADLSGIPEDARRSMPRAVSIAVPVKPEIAAEIMDGPTPQYKAEYDRLNGLLGELAAYAAEMIEQAGYCAIARQATHQEIDWDKLTTKLPHKTVATRAGLGWIGKNATLVTSDYGNSVRITSVFTDAPLEVAEPIDESRCGDCTACADACPGGAVSGRNWKAGMERAEFFDAFSCRDASRAHEERYGVTICGMCIPACPWTQKRLKREGAM